MSSGLQLFVSLKELGGDPVQFDIVATPAEQQALRKRFGLVRLEQLTARGTIFPLRDGAALQVEGQIQAQVTQNCVVTLEPVVQAVDEAFVLEFGEAADVIDVATGELVVTADQDQPEPMPQNGLDIGALVAEQLALAIDPYPRKEGADLNSVLRQHGLDPEPGKISPFAALAALKTKG